MIDCKIESFVYYEHHKDDYVLPHHHSYLEMVFYLSGNGEVFLNGEKYYFKKNTVSIINPYDKHDEISKSASNVFIILFSMKSKVNWPSTFIDLDEKTGDKIAKTLYKIKKEYAEQQPHYQQMVNAYFMYVIVEILRFGRKKKNGKKNESEIKSIIEQAKRFLKENYSQDIDYRLLCNSFGYSYDRFRHIFAKETGNSLAQYLLTIRFTKAKALLETTTKSVKEIALECGFSTDSHFVNFFTKKMGMSPIKYREIVNLKLKSGVFGLNTEDGGSDMINSKKVKVILDTDLGGDCDDVGALALLHVLANKAEAEIIGISHTTSSRYGVACIDIINNFYERPMLIGDNKLDTHLAGQDSGKYTARLVEKFHSKYMDRSLAMESTSYLRRCLTGVEGKVKLVAIGQLNNFARLLRSEADEFSPLSGRELIESKVDEVVVMGGLFASNDEPVIFDNKPYLAEYNIVSDLSSSKYFIENCPVKITFIDFLIGYKVKTLGKLVEFDNLDNPVTYSYKCYCNGARESWDLIAVLYAIRGKGEIFETSPNGIVSVNDEGITTFKEDVNGKHTYLINKIGDEQLAHYIDEIILSDKI